MQIQKSEKFRFNKSTTDLANAKPFGDAFTMVNMLARQFYLPVTSFVPHLANHTSVCRQYKYIMNQLTQTMIEKREKPQLKKKVMHLVTIFLKGEAKPPNQIYK